MKIEVSIDLLKDFFDNWELTIISVLIILGVILIYEIYSLRKIVISLSYIPKPRDKRIINELLTDLDIEDFENSIYKLSLEFFFQNTFNFFYSFLLKINNIQQCFCIFI